MQRLDNEQKCELIPNRYWITTELLFNPCNGISYYVTGTFFFLSGLIFGKLIQVNSHLRLTSSVIQDVIA